MYLKTVQDQATGYPSFHCKVKVISMPLTALCYTVKLLLITNGQAINEKNYIWK